jgi:hypothetical protein
MPPAADLAAFERAGAARGETLADIARRYNVIGSTISRLTA